MRVAVTVVRSSDNIDPVSPDHGPRPPVAPCHGALLLDFDKFQPRPSHDTIITPQHSLIGLHHS